MDKRSQGVLCSGGGAHVAPHFLARKAKKCRCGYFLFRVGCYTNLLLSGSMHNAGNPSSARIITLSVNSAQLCGKYCCWESGCYSRGGSTRCRPSWDEPKHIPCVTVYLCWEEAWLTAAWHFIKQISGTLKPRPCRVSERSCGVVSISCLLMENTWTYYILDCIYMYLLFKNELTEHFPAL